VNGKIIVKNEIVEKGRVVKFYEGFLGFGPTLVVARTRMHPMWWFNPGSHYGMLTAVSASYIESYSRTDTKDNVSMRYFYYSMLLPISIRALI
jgi:hypothetical protein